MNGTAPVLLIEKQDSILLLRLNRPEKLNVLSAALNHAIGTCVKNAAADDIDVIVITGAGGKSFCAGGDMLEMSGVEADSLPDVPKQDRLDGAIEIARTPVPVIAAIDGFCYGGGARLALECDIRLISEKSTFRWPGAEYGLVVGASSLPRLVGAAKAKEWIFTARKINAQEALAERMVNAMLPVGQVLDAALEMAQQIAKNSTSAVRESKRVIDLASISSAARTEESAANKVLQGSNEQSSRFRSATKKVTGR